MTLRERFAGKPYIQSEGNKVVLSIDEALEIVRLYEQLDGAAGKWISVKERLPERGDPVLCQEETWGTTVGHWGNTFDGGVEWRCEAYSYPQAITHWQPLPDPPDRI